MTNHQNTDIDVRPAADVFAARAAGSEMILTLAAEVELPTPEFVGIALGVEETSIKLADAAQVQAWADQFGATVETRDSHGVVLFTEFKATVYDMPIKVYAHTFTANVKVMNP